MDFKLFLLLAVAAALTSRTDGVRTNTPWAASTIGGQVVGWSRSELDDITSPKHRYYYEFMLRYPVPTRRTKKTTPAMPTPATISTTTYTLFIMFNPSNGKNSDVYFYNTLIFRYSYCTVSFKSG